MQQENGRKFGHAITGAGIKRSIIPRQLLLSSTVRHSIYMGLLYPFH